jgi:diguanylate cyclase (GGDEF)-like protein
VTLDARDRSRAAVSLAPFAGAAVLAWLVVTIGTSIHWAAYGASLALLVLTGLLLGIARTDWWSPKLGLVPASYGFLIAVAVLRGSAVGINSGAAALSLIPIFYTALSGADRRQMYLVLVGLAACYLIPIIFIGAPTYPHTEYRTALLVVPVSSVIGIATHDLVTRVRLQAAEAGHRERMLEQVGQLVRGLFDSANPRKDVCEAPRAISDATVALLMEPTESGSMISTAMAGLDAPPIELPAHHHHPVHEAFRTGRPRLVSGDIGSFVTSSELWRASGSPATLLFQPLLKGSEVSGVLVVGWPEGVEVTGSRSTVVALLAHEAALAINRADQIRLLAGMAQTDPLTGLPNRRAWDARLTQAVAHGQEFAVAILDLDHFKRFNDTNGHPAGDRLLKETAAVWREQLRAGDLLARLGGEEFGLLLFDCDLEAACDVTERLRDRVTNGQTASVGLTLRRGEEPIDSVLSRADRALYDAKATGRDRAYASV